MRLFFFFLVLLGLVFFNLGMEEGNNPVSLHTNHFSLLPDEQLLQLIKEIIYSSHHDPRAMIKLVRTLKLVDKRLRQIVLDKAIKKLLISTIASRAAEDHMLPIVVACRYDFPCMVADHLEKNKNDKDVNESTFYAATKDAVNVARFLMKQDIKNRYQWCERFRELNASRIARIANYINPIQWGINWIFSMRRNAVMVNELKTIDQLSDEKIHTFLINHVETMVAKKCVNDGMSWADVVFTYDMVILAAHCLNFATSTFSLNGGIPMPALVCAVTSGAFDIAQRCLEHGADANVRNYNGTKVLCYASNGNMRALLQSYGATLGDD